MNVIMQVYIDALVKKGVDKKILVQTWDKINGQIPSVPQVVYDNNINFFSDGTRLCWTIDQNPRDMTDNLHLDAKIINRSPTVWIPINREMSETREIEIPDTVITARDLLQFMYDFYHTPRPLNELGDVGTHYIQQGDTATLAIIMGY